MPDPSKYVPASDLVTGIELVPLPDNYTPLEAVVLIKALDDEGNICWLTRYSKELHMIEALGALTAAQILCQHDVQLAYTPEDDT